MPGLGLFTMGLLPSGGASGGAAASLRKFQRIPNTHSGYYSMFGTRPASPTAGFYQELQEARNTLRKSIVMPIVTDQDKFKTVLQDATSKYINIVKNKCCREDGRVRANNFLEHLKFSNVTVIVNQLSLLLKHGNEDPDSLKTILAKALASAFLSEREKKEFNQKYSSWSFLGNYTYFLSGICEQLQILVSKQNHQEQDLSQLDEKATASKLQLGKGNV